MKQPIQPIEDHRFVPNKIVRHLLDDGPFDMNSIAIGDFTAEDREQFAQLIGYSLSGAAELDYFTDETLDAANLMAEHGMSEDKAKINSLRDKLELIRKPLREAAVEAFRVHPDDLVGD